MKKLVVLASSLLVSGSLLAAPDTPNLPTPDQPTSLPSTPVAAPVNQTAPVPPADAETSAAVDKEVKKEKKAKSAKAKKKNAKKQKAKKSLNNQTEAPKQEADPALQGQP